MRDFQKQLDSELQKRGLKEPEKEKKSRFSFMAFLQGLFLCFFASGILVAWAAYWSDVTQDTISKKLPSKTAIVTTGADPVLRVGVQNNTAQPVVRMPPAQDINPPETTAVTPTEPQETVEVIETPTPENTAPIEQVEKNNKGMVPAPVPGLFENTTVGQIPKIRESDQLSAFKAYKHPFIKDANKPSLSIVITNLGVSKKMIDGVIENFPDEVSLALSPYTNNLNDIIKQARDNGHETWLMLPLETQNYPLDDPGPWTLLSNGNLQQNNDRLMRTMAAAQGYVGFIPSKSHIYTTEDANINPSIKEIFERGLALLDSKEGANSFVKNLADREGYPYGFNNFWLDDDLTPMALNRQLRMASEYASANGKATIMLRPYPASIKALQKFLNSAAAKDFQLAPASAMITYGG